MSTADTTVDAFADPRPSSAEQLPECAPIPQAALGPALNEQGDTSAGSSGTLNWVNEGTYQRTFLTTRDGFVLLGAPSEIGNNIKRAVDEVVAGNRVSSRATISPSRATTPTSFSSTRTSPASDTRRHAPLQIRLAPRAVARGNERRGN